ncbi:conserved hypothetical protein [Burkholderia ambifaria IOP40-10]|uniref:Uncharacterized protein n=1 Tax=Burkholderia ambifaria IOP40-10 TaxID=396596 RepID=B1FEA8_9BURK|nr:conserved hypothetical protein [Burkholderia ambifaria IOP40-10]
MIHSRCPLLACSLLLCLTLSSAGWADTTPDTTPRIGIGTQEPDPQTHLAFPNVPSHVIRVSTHVVIDQAPNHGLNYFALQVNFPNSTWAHGGILLVDNRQQANWGGLVDRGGGSHDYTHEDPAKDILLLQNPTGKHHTGPYAWALGNEYEIAIERGERVTLPPGDYTYIDGTASVHLTEPRTMWEWNLSIRPEGGGGTTFTSTLYNNSDFIDYFLVWNECGYGACDHPQHARWSPPLYRTSGAPDTDRVATDWYKF